MKKLAILLFIIITLSSCKDGLQTPDPPAPPIEPVPDVMMNTVLFTDTPELAITISWQPGEDDTYGFVILRSVDGNSDYAELYRSPSMSSSYIDYDIKYMTEYRYKLAFFDADGNTGRYSNPVLVYSGIPVVTNVRSDVHNDTVSLQWDAIPGVDSYEIYEVDFSSPIAENITENYYAITNPSISKRYYTVRAVWNGIRSLDSEQVSAWLIPYPAPTGLKIDANSYKEVSFSWDPIDGAHSYEVLRSVDTSLTGDSIVIASDVSVTNYTDTALGDATDYYYFVRAVRPGGARGIASDALKITVEPLEKVAGVVFTELGDGSGVEINWNSISNPELHYEVYVEYKTGSSFIEESYEVSDTSYVYKWKDTDVYYRLYVRSGYKNRNSELSAPYEYWPLTPPQYIRKSFYTAGISLSWRIPLNAPKEMLVQLIRTDIATGDLHVSDVSFPESSFGNGYDFYYTDTDFQFLKQYAYKVRCTYKGRTSDSSEIIIYMPGRINYINSNTLKTQDSLQLSWSDVDYAESYNIYRSDYEFGPFSLIGNSITTSYLDSGLKTASTYFYQVKAVLKGREGIAGTHKFYSWGIAPDSYPSISYNSQGPGDNFFEIDLSYFDSDAYLINVRYDANQNGIFTDPGDEIFRLTENDSIYISQLPFKYTPVPEKTGDYYFQITPVLIDGSTITTSRFPSVWSFQKMHYRK